jgi:spore coat polysaccharide biosynthesis protein SpsF
MTVLVLLQARTSSSRLPGKVLLPLGGQALALLCAERLGNTGHRVVLCTSDQSDDDPLALLAQAAGVGLHRGPLDNVQQRLLQALDGVPDEALVVRATADNPVPDGHFIDELIALRAAAGADYCGPFYPADGLPYGMSVELFTAGMLRQAAAVASSDAEREHVTPWMRRHLRVAGCRVAHLPPGGLAQLRCTVDSYDDYERMAALFAAPERRQAPWRALCAALAASLGAPQFRLPPGRDGATSRMALGTVQLGMPYGIANRHGMPSAATAQAVVREAIAHGVGWLDTARAYGEAESRLGQALAGSWRDRAQVITKLAPLAELAEPAPPAALRAAVECSVYQSLYALQARRLPVLLLHRAEHLHAHGGALWAVLQELQAQGLIGELGVSVATPAQAVAALACPGVQHVQLPCNLLDWRWQDPAFVAARAARPDVRMHVRSAFLQGLLLSEAARWPAWHTGAGGLCEELDRLVQDCGRRSRADLALAWLLAQDWIDAVVVGVETLDQLHENLDLFRQAPLAPAEQALVTQRVGRAPERLLNPALWQEP